ncbi:MAG TPA: hypothetical protein VMH34_03995 [Gammaproteobacteria bacterium]|nr:hypothetical protein [Gammaproteobacteria bacterium]
MSIGRHVTSRRHLRGQAMTELAITASFVLVPIFLMIPLLGKYIDIRHSTIQAARYEAWEYTVWYASKSDLPDGFGLPQPVKDVYETQREARRRFFSDTKIPISDNDRTGWKSADRNLTWTDHRGGVLYSGTPPGTPDVPGPDLTPDPTHIFSGVLKVVSLAFQALQSVLNFFGVSAGFTAINADGYFKSSVASPVANVAGLAPFDTINLSFNAKASVLADGWNSGGTAQTAYQAAGIVPTKLLDNPVMNGLQSIVGILAPELRPCDPWVPFPPWNSDDKGSLWFGYIANDAVHPDRLASGGSHSCNDAGMCDFDPAPPMPTDCHP